MDIDEKIPLLLDGPNGDGGKVPNVRIRREGKITFEITFIGSELVDYTYSFPMALCKKSPHHKCNKLGSNAARKLFHPAFDLCLLKNL